MKLVINNCSNIEEAIIEIDDSKLNIKYGNNGIGKSTIAKAILYGQSGSLDLQRLLTPLKKGIDVGVKPSIGGLEKIKNPLIFNEDYVNKFLFRPDELVANSFDIFIRSTKYTNAVNKINNFIEGLRKVFNDDQDLLKTISDLEALLKSFKVTSSGISKSSEVYKSLSNGNNIHNIPPELDLFSTFLKDNNIRNRWLDWHNKGNEFLHVVEECPYCVATVDYKKRDSIELLDKTYDLKNVRHLTSILNILNEQHDYFSEITFNELTNITQKSTILTEEDWKYLFRLRGEIVDFVDSLKKIDQLSPIKFLDIVEAKDFIQSLSIDIGRYEKLNSTKTSNITTRINDELAVVLREINTLQNEIEIQREEIKLLINKNEQEINDFLKNAGYKYAVSMVNEDGKFKLKLRHHDFEQSIEGGNQYLSFGERNAFALVLFMYESLSKESDLIILDDPISSFDKNKKYAIMDMLFQQEVCLKGKTVLMLTHDIEPIIDVLLSKKEDFKNIASASFLKLEGGKLIEKKIKRKDLLPFTKICQNVFKSTNDDLVKIIYIRRYLEIISGRNNGWQVISNLFHGRKEGEATDNRVKDGKLEKKDFSDGVLEIQKILPSFDYNNILKRICDKEDMKNTYRLAEHGYEKINIFRILYPRQPDRNVLRKFINESYHIENELIYQLDYKSFDPVPSYIIKECDDFINTHTN